jgi:hypothetical protein
MPQRYDGIAWVSSACPEKGRRCDWLYETADVELVRRGLQRLQDSFFKRRPIVSHGSPDGIHVDVIVLMPEPVADAPNITPRKSRAESLSLIARPDGGFADHLEFALDGRDGFRIFEECGRNVSSSSPFVNSLMAATAAMASAMSRKESAGSLKGQYGLLRSPASDRLL